MAAILVRLVRRSSHAEVRLLAGRLLAASLSNASFIAPSQQQLFLTLASDMDAPQKAAAPGRTASIECRRSVAAALCELLFYAATQADVDRLQTLPQSTIISLVEHTALSRISYENEMDACVRRYFVKTLCNICVAAPNLLIGNNLNTAMLQKLCTCVLQDPDTAVVSAAVVAVVALLRAQQIGMLAAGLHNEIFRRVQTDLREPLEGLDREMCGKLIANVCLECLRRT
jgi:hypothetical protein